MSKIQDYHELKLKEKAKALVKEENLPYAEALRRIRSERDLSEDKQARMAKRKSKTSQKRLSRRLQKERNKSVRQLGNKLTPGAPPYQGGAPDSGKR